MKCQSYDAKANDACGESLFSRAVPLKPIPTNIWIWLRHAPCGANPGAKKIEIKLSGCQKKKKAHVVEDYGLEPWVRLGWHFTVARHRIISERLIPVIILLQLLHDGKRDGRCHARIQKPHIMSQRIASQLWATDFQHEKRDTSPCSLSSLQNM